MFRLIINYNQKLLNKSKPQHLPHKDWALSLYSVKTDKQHTYFIILMHNLSSTTIITTGSDITSFLQLLKFLNCAVCFPVVAETLLFCISNILIKAE